MSLRTSPTASCRPSPLASRRHALIAVVAAALTAAALPISGLSDDVTAIADDAAPQVLLETSLGDITLELDRARAPGTVANYLEYVDEGFYDGTIFHRVIEGFMVQGGGFTDSLMKKNTRAPIANEADNGLSNQRYTIAMARTSEPHSATAQFFINHVDNTMLDHSGKTPRGWGYTVFGRVIDGQDTIDTIAETATGAAGPFRSDVPQDTIAILSARRIGDTDDATDIAASGEDDSTPDADAATR